MSLNPLSPVLVILLRSVALLIAVGGAGYLLHFRRAKKGFGQFVVIVSVSSLVYGIASYLTPSTQIILNPVSRILLAFAGIYLVVASVSYILFFRDRKSGLGWFVLFVSVLSALLEAAAYLIIRH